MFSLGTGTSTETLALTSVSTTLTGNGVVSVVGSDIYLGDGNSATIIATIAGGTSGTDLVVTANSSFPADHTVMEKIASWSPTTTAAT